MSAAKQDDFSRFAPELPDALKRQKAEVEAMFGQAPVAPAGGSEAPEGAGDAGVQPQPGMAVPEAASPETPPAEGGDPVAREEPKAPEVSETPPEPKQDGNPELDALRAKLAAMEQEAKTWKGRERKAREEAAAQVAELKAQIAKLEKPEAPPLAAVTPDEIEAYGSDLLEVAKRYALADIGARIEAAVEPLLARIKALEGGVQAVASTAADTAWDKFEARLEKRVPDWKKIDAMPEFGQWLDSLDPAFGVPNRDALDSATANLDDTRTAAVFERFLAQTGKKAEGSRDSKRGSESPAAGTGAQPTAPQAPATDEAPSLEALAAPGRPNSSQPTPMSATPGARVWTISEIESYYRDRAAGRHPHSRDPKAALAMDAEIAMAQQEGRVRA